MLTAEDRFWLHVDIDGPPVKGRPALGQCHLWTGSLNSTGYGTIKVDGVTIGAHVMACRLVDIEIPAGYEPDHLCRRPACVRVEHFEIVTVAENRRRAALTRS